MEFMIFLMPVALILMAWNSRKSGVVATFISAGAVSETTARKPASIGKLHPDFVKGAARRGTLVDMGDGRYYVNIARVEQRKRRLIVLLIGAGVLTAASCAWVVWRMWG